MSWDVMAEIALKSLLVSALALLALALLRRRSAAERSWVAHAGLAATLLIPLAVISGPRWEVEAPAPMAFAVPTTAAEPVAPVLPGLSQGGAQPSGEAAAQSAWTMPDPALLLWGTPAALLLLITLVAVLRLHRLRSRAQVLVEQDWLTALARAQRRMGFKHGTALLVSGELSSPVSWGVLRPIILLNEAAVGSRGQAEAIIAHELAHVARLDWLKLLVARGAVALFWFNPLVWLLARQCHQLREEAADDAVLSSDVVNTDYAALLVGAARHESRGLLLAANGVAPGRGSLKRRVARVLDTGLSRGPARTAWSSACAAGAALVAIPLAAFAPVAALAVEDPAPPAFADAPALPLPPSEHAAEPEALIPLEMPEPPAAPIEATAVAEAERPVPPAASHAGGLIAVPRFSSLDLAGGGHVTIRHGAVQSVRLLSGDPGQAQISVDGSGRLRLVPCSGSCGNPGLVVEIVVPSLEAVSITGGGSIVAEGRFAVQPSLAIALEGGGHIDLRALAAAKVAAAISGGGEIMTHPRSALIASINGGGAITYWGDPAVMSSVNGGGTVAKATR